MSHTILRPPKGVSTNSPWLLSTHSLMITTYSPSPELFAPNEVSLSFKAELRTVGNFNKEVRMTKNGSTQTGVKVSYIPYFKLSFTMIPVNYRQELAFVIWTVHYGQLFKWATEQVIVPSIEQNRLLCNQVTIQVLITQTAQFRPSVSSPFPT